MTNLPLGSYNQIIFDTHRSLENRVGDEIEECMRVLGFDYQHPRPEPIVVAFRRYGLLDGNAALYVPSVPEDQGEVEAEESEAFLQALFGGSGPVTSTTPIEDDDGRKVGFTWRADGCLGQAQEVAFGSLDEYQRFASEDLLVQVTLSEATEELWSSDEVQEAIQPWVSCLVDLGFERPNRLDYYFLKPWATAAAELECKTAEVLEAVFRLDWVHQSAVLDDNAALFDSYGSWSELIDRPSDG
jgi:hypothetical protein